MGPAISIICKFQSNSTLVAPSSLHETNKPNVNPLDHAAIAPWLSACQNAGGRVLFWISPTPTPFIGRNKLKTNKQVSQMAEKSYHNSLPSKLFSLDDRPNICGSPSLTLGLSQVQVSLDLIWICSVISQFDPEFLTDLEKYQLCNYTCLLECFNTGLKAD